MERLVGRRTALALLGMPAALSLSSVLTGCSKNAQDSAPDISATELTAGVKDAALTQEPIANALTGQTATDALFGFTSRLLQGTYPTNQQINVLVSPLSALFALALAGAGAAGDTLSQLGTATGMDIDSLATYLGACVRRISGEDLYDTQQKGDALALKCANSIWLRSSDDLSVSEDYLAACKDSFDAQAFSAPFDPTTAEDINSWVSSKTDGMIDQLVDRIAADDQLFLINALAFDDVWQEPYEESDVQGDTFATEKGDEQSVRMMHSHETAYLENSLAEGFLKPYKNYNFAFVALLPKQGVQLADLVASLDGTSLLDMITNPVPNIEVSAGLPKFSLDYQTTLNDQLVAMGVRDAFDPNLANFSRMATLKDGNLAISAVLQKTFIDVNEAGTKAAAVTAIGEAGSTATPDEPEVREVILDRPFVYFIIDNMTLTPLFAGVLTHME